MGVGWRDGSVRLCTFHAEELSSGLAPQVAQKPSKPLTPTGTALMSTYPKQTNMYTHDF